MTRTCLRSFFIFLIMPDDSGALVSRAPSGWRLASTVTPFVFTAAPGIVSEAMRGIYRNIDWSNSRLNAAIQEQQEDDRRMSMSQPPRTRARTSGPATSYGYRYLLYPRRRIIRRRRTAYYYRRRYRY